MVTKKKEKVKKDDTFNKDGIEKIGSKLTPKQEFFCRLYTQNSELFGNATLSYAQAYGYKLDILSTEAEYEEVENDDGTFTRKKIKDSPYDLACNTCAVSGMRLLRSAQVNKRMSELLNNLMTNTNADAELAYLMQQRKDPGVKLGALREFNKLKGRIKNIIQIEDTPIDDKLRKKANQVLDKYIDELIKDPQK